MAGPIRLVLIDQPTLSRRCLAAYLRRRPGLRVVGEAAAGAEGRSAAALLAPDVVVVDPDVPDGGPALVHDLCRALPQSAVLVLSIEGRDAVIGNSLQAGARGYVQKSCEPLDLVHAIRRVHAGGVLVASAPPGLPGADPQPRSSPAPETLLTARERDVLRLVAHGRTNAEIAEALSIGEHTTKGHLGSLLRKLGLDNRVHLAAYAFEHGVADPNAVLTAVPDAPP